MDEELEQAINQFRQHGQFFLNEEDIQAVELIIERLEQALNN